MTITVSALPTPPSRQDPTNFRTRADDFLAALPDFVSDVNTQNQENNQINANINAQVATATIAAANAVVSANAAAATSTAPIWVSGTTYSAGNIRRSLIDGLPYVRLTDGDGTTDPRNDSTNWALGVFQYETGLPDIRPTLLLDPCNSGVVDSRIGFTRTSTATYWDAFGNIQTAPANTLRIDHDPVTGECLGYLVEGQSINLLLNSLVDGTPLSTQNITVGAVRYCISFYGVGTITLSGAYSASIVGTSSVGRTYLIFTSNAGTLTVTVSGDVRYAQLESDSGTSRPTSFIPTTGSPGNRAAEFPLVSSSSFTSFYKQNQGTFVIEVSPPQLAAGSGKGIFGVSNINWTDQMYVSATPTDLKFAVIKGSVVQADLSAPAPTSTIARIAVSYKENQFAMSVNGSQTLSDNSGSPPVVDRLALGGLSGFSSPNNHYIRQLKYFPRSVTAAELQALSRI